MRWLGVDPGSARVGIAACDPEERIAVPLEVVPGAAAFPAIRAIALREGVGGIVMGLPVSLDGVERRPAELARKLGARLAKDLGLPVYYEDERLTSIAAQRTPVGIDPRSSRGARDDIAAALLLQQFLDRRTHERARAEHAAP